MPGADTSTPARSARRRAAITLDPAAADAAHRPLDLLQCLGPSHARERTAALAAGDTEILNIVL